MVIRGLKSASLGWLLRWLKRGSFEWLIGGLKGAVLDGY